MCLTWFLRHVCYILSQEKKLYIFNLSHLKVFTTVDYPLFCHCNKIKRKQIIHYFEVTQSLQITVKNKKRLLYRQVYKTGKKIVQQKKDS